MSRHTVNVTIGELRRCLGHYGSWVVWRPKIGYCLRGPQYDTLVHMGWHFANLRSRGGFEGQAACYLM